MCRAAVDPIDMANNITEGAKWLLLLINHRWTHPLHDVDSTGSINLIKHLNTRRPSGGRVGLT